MKKIIAALFGVLLLSGCDRSETIVEWMHTCYFTWTNESTHTVTLALPDAAFTDVAGKRGFEAAKAYGEPATEQTAE